MISSIEREGILMTSFQMLGSIHFSLQLDSFPDVGETNLFLESMRGRPVRVTIEEIEEVV